MTFATWIGVSMLRTDRLYIKLFREEVDLFAYIFVDASASMAFPSPKKNFSWRATSPPPFPMSSWQITITSNSICSATTRPTRPHLLSRAASHNRLHPIHHLIDARGTLELAPALAEHLRRLRRPGKAILISDF